MCLIWPLSLAHSFYPLHLLFPQATLRTQGQVPVLPAYKMKEKCKRFPEAGHYVWLYGDLFVLCSYLCLVWNVWSISVGNVLIQSVFHLCLTTQWGKVHSVHSLSSCFAQTVDEWFSLILWQKHICHFKYPVPCLTCYYTHILLNMTVGGTTVRRSIRTRIGTGTKVNKTDGMEESFHNSWNILSKIYINVKTLVFLDYYSHTMYTNRSPRTARSLSLIWLQQAVRLYAREFQRCKQERFATRFPKDCYTHAGMHS